MKSRFKRAVSTVVFCLAFQPSVAKAADRDEIGESEIYVMTPFEINAERPWLYTSIDGYEILSLLRSEDTLSVAERIQRDIRFAPLLLPKTVIIRIESTCALVFQEFDNPDIMAKFRTRLPRDGSTDYALFDQGDRFIAFLPETTIAALLEGRRSGVNTPLTGHLFSHFSLAAPKLPPWFLDGLKLLLRNARVKDDTLTIYGPQTIEPDSIPIQVTLTATPMEISALRSRWKAEHTKYELRSALFVHWGFFSDNGRRREAFMRFVAATSQEPITEGVLIEYLGFGYTELGRILDRYVNTWWRSKRTITLSDEIAQEPMPPVRIRPASRSEVARIQGEAYISLARGDTGIAPDPRYLIKARNTLKDAYQAGDRSPKIKIIYGMLEVAEGDDEEARRIFEDVAASDHHRPRAHYELARLRLAAARNHADGQTRLDAETVSSVNEPLMKALVAEPPMEAAYQLAIALWTATEYPPRPDQLAVLARGARTYPENITLVLLIASIHYQHGATETSLELGKLGLRWLGDSPTARRRRLKAAPKAARIYEMTTILWTVTDATPSRSELTWLADGVAEYLQWSDLVYDASRLLEEYGLTDQALKLVTLGLPFAESGLEIHDRLLDLQARLSVDPTGPETHLPPR